MSKTAQVTIPAPPEPLEEIIRRVGDVSTLPQVALRVMEVARDPEAGIADMTKVIEGDAPLSAKVLRTVNSAVFGVGSEINSLHHAVSYLGFNQVRNLAMTLSVAKTFKKQETIGSYERTQLWRHLVCVALCARMIAARCSLPNFEDAFLAGLLHDLGIILEDQYVHKNFRRVMENLAEGKTLIEVEQEILGFDHTKIGHRMAKRWKFPDVVQAAIRYHHTSHEYDGDGVEIVRCVELANLLCTIKGIPSVGLKLVKPNLESIQALKLTKEDLKVLAADLDGEIERNHSLFDVL